MENINTTYSETLNNIRNAMMAADTQEKTDAQIDALKEVLEGMKSVETYAFWSNSLSSYLDRCGTENMDYVTQYVGKLAELVDETEAAEQRTAEEAVKAERVERREAAVEAAKAKYEDAKVACSAAVNAARERATVVKQEIKEKGPGYAVAALNFVKGVSQEIGDGVKKWLEEDSEEDNE